MSDDEGCDSDCSFTTPTDWDSDDSFDTPPSSPVPSSSEHIQNVASRNACSLVPSSSEHIQNVASTSELNNDGLPKILLVVSKTIGHLFAKLTLRTLPEHEPCDEPKVTDVAMVRRRHAEFVARGRCRIQMKTGARVFPPVNKIPANRWAHLVFVVYGTPSCVETAKQLIRDLALYSKEQMMLNKELGGRNVTAKKTFEELLGIEVVPPGPVTRFVDMLAFVYRPIRRLLRKCFKGKKFIKRRVVEPAHIRHIPEPVAEAEQPQVAQCEESQHDGMTDGLCTMEMEKSITYRTKETKEGRPNGECCDSDAIVVAHCKESQHGMLDDVTTAEKITTTVTKENKGGTPGGACSASDNTLVARCEERSQHGMTDGLCTTESSTTSEAKEDKAGTSDEACSANSNILATEKDANVGYVGPIKDDDVLSERIIGMPLWKPPKGFYQINRSWTLAPSSEAGSMPYTYDKELDLQCDDQDQDSRSKELLEVLKIREHLLGLILTEKEVVTAPLTAIEAASGARIVKQNICNEWRRLFIRGTRKAVDEARRIIQEKLERMVMQNESPQQLDDILDMWWIGFPLMKNRIHTFESDVVSAIIRNVDVCTKMYRVPCPLNSPLHQESLDQLNSVDLVLEVVTLTALGLKTQQVANIAISTETIIYPTFCEELSFYFIGRNDLVKKAKQLLIQQEYEIRAVNDRIGMPLWKAPYGFGPMHKSSILNSSGSSKAGKPRTHYTYDSELDPLRTFPKKKSSGNKEEN